MHFDATGGYQSGCRAGLRLKEHSQLRNDCCPKKVIISNNAKSILLQKVPHKVFWGKQTSEKSQKHTGARLHPEIHCAFDVAPSIKTHSCSFSPFTSAGAVQQIIVLFEHDVLFTE